MTRDREIAEALSNGINCVYAIVSSLRAGTTPDPEWLATLHGMEGALDATTAGEVMTSMVVSEEERERVRRLRVLVSDWTTTGQPAPDLQALAELVLRSFGVHP